MHDEEQDEQVGGDEVDGARRLAAAEQVNEHRRDGVEPRRHGEAGQHDGWEQDENDGDVGELLQRVVPLGGRAGDALELDVMDDLPPQVAAAKFVLAGEDVALEVAVGEAEGDVGEAVDHQEPGEEEVPVPSGGEVSKTGQGEKPRNAVGESEERRVVLIAALAPVKLR